MWKTLTVRDRPLGLKLARRLAASNLGRHDSDAKRSVVPLSKFVSCTEHFAHATDFVAELGVMRQESGTQHAITSGYDVDPVFRSKDGRGHLFGAHYSLDKEDYDQNAHSNLVLPSVIRLSLIPHNPNPNRSLNHRTMMVLVNIYSLVTVMVNS
jgi:hypothetical protein